MSVQHPEPDHVRAHKALCKLAAAMKGGITTQALIGKIEAMGDDAIKLIAEHVDEVLAAEKAPGEKVPA